MIRYAVTFMIALMAAWFSLGGMSAGAAGIGKAVAFVLALLAMAGFVLDVHARR